MPDVGLAGHLCGDQGLPGPIAHQAYLGLGVEPFAWLGVAISLAKSLAPATAGLLAGWSGLPAVFALFALLSATVFVGLPLLGRPLPKPTGADEAHVPLRHWVRDATFMLSIATALSTGLLVGHRNSYLPIHLDSIGLSISTIGALLSRQASAGVLVQTQLPYLARRFGSPPLVVAAFLIAVPVLAIMPWLRHWAVLAGGMALLGLSTGRLHPVTMALTARAVPGKQQGLALGLRSTALRLGNSLGPPGFGLVAAFVSVPATFTAAAGLAALGAAGGWSILKRRQAGGIEQHLPAEMAETALGPPPGSVKSE